MKYLLLLQILFTFCFASALNINSFKADFTQTVIDDKGKKLLYSGHMIASKPQYALWIYTKPIKKSVYITPNYVTVIEPEIEQAIIRKVSSDFDFFNMINKAKKKKDNTYIATLNESEYTVLVKNNIIESISYLDEFENEVTIIFTKQQNNLSFSEDIFKPKVPVEYDIIRD